jgi:hypothetical protein
MIVNFFVPGEEVSSRGPRFKYLLTAEPEVTGKGFNVTITDLNPPQTPHALPPGEMSVPTEDVETALLGAVARLNSHHDGLRHVTGKIEMA